MQLNIPLNRKKHIKCTRARDFTIKNTKKIKISKFQINIHDALSPFRLFLHICQQSHTHLLCLCRMCNKKPINIVQVYPISILSGTQPESLHHISYGADTSTTTACRNRKNKNCSANYIHLAQDRTNFAMFCMFWQVADKQIKQQRWTNNTRNNKLEAN